MIPFLLIFVYLLGGEYLHWKAYSLQFIPIWFQLRLRPIHTGWDLIHLNLINQNFKDHQSVFELFKPFFYFLWYFIFILFVQLPLFTVAWAAPDPQTEAKLRLLVGYLERPNQDPDWVQYVLTQLSEAHTSTFLYRVEQESFLRPFWQSAAS